MNTPVTSTSAPQTLEEYSQYALSLQRADKPLEAAQAYITILRQVPTHWPSYYNLGLVFQQLNRLEDARLAYERAVELNPQLAQGFNNLGIVLQALNHADAAATAYERALAIDPALSQAQYNLALVLQGRGRFTDSTASLRRAVAANPKDDLAWDALYRALLGLKRHDEAGATFLEWEAAIEKSPLLTAAGLAQCRYLADRAREEKYVKLAIEWPFERPAPEQLASILGMLQYFDVDLPDILRVYQRFDAAIASTHPQQVSLLPRRSQGAALRIGYVSADFRRHVMGRIMLDVVREHDRERFAVHLISLTEVNLADATTAEFARLEHALIDVSKLSDFEAARALAALDLDVLVDLAGHTVGARPGIYAHRPARKIVTHLGYHGCLGMSAVDYKMTDRVADLPSASAYQIEKPLFLDACLFPLVHVEPVADDIARYRAMRVPHTFVFATFVNVLKLSARCLRAWKQILDQAPAAVLAFSPLHDRDKPAIYRLTAAAGIAPERLRFIPWDASEHTQRARYAAVDAVLDTFPYAGGDTTLAALDCDVPVVTLAGTRNAGRVGVSILTYLGVKDSICTSEEEYVARAVRCVNDATWFNTIRARFVEARKLSAFAEVATHTRALEVAYVSIAANTSDQQGTLSARAFFQRFDELVRSHQSARSDADKAAVQQQYAALQEEQPDYAPLLRIRAALCREMGDIAQSLQLLGRAHTVAPDDAEIAAALAELLIDSGEDDQAETVIARTGPLAPSSTPLALAHARLRLRVGDAEAALQRCDEIVSRAPTNTAARLMQANAYADLGCPLDALNTYKHVLALDPNSFEANYNAGLLALDCGELAFAEAALRKAVDRNPAHEFAQLRLAQVLFSQRKTDAWVALAKRIATAFPRSARAALLRAEAWRFEGEPLREAAEILKIAESLLQEPDYLLVEDLAAHILRRRAALELDDRLADALSRSHEAAVCAIHGRAASKAPAAFSQQPLRIGLLLDAGHGMLQDQMRIGFAGAFAQRLSDGESNVQIYVLDRLIAEFAGPLKAPSKSIAGLSAPRAAGKIAEDNIDVLIDLVGLRHPLAPAILAHQPARLSVTNPAFAAMFDEVGCVDFEAFDEWTALPQWSSRGPSRPMLRLQALLPSTARPTLFNVNTTQTRPFVYATLAAVEDIPHASLVLWKDILMQVPESKFAVPADGDMMLRAYHRLLQSVGIGASRIVAFSLDAVRAGQKLDGIDLIVDTLSCNTGMATATALDLDCAVVTMRGPSAAERISYSVLARHGLLDLVADSPKDVVKIAVRMAADVAWREQIRTTLGARAVSGYQPGADLATLRAALTAKAEKHAKSGAK
jgi:protein O-GlcNAc transferase